MSTGLALTIIACLVIVIIGLLCERYEFRIKKSSSAAPIVNTLEPPSIAEDGTVTIFNGKKFVFYKGVWYFIEWIDSTSQKPTDDTILMDYLKNTYKDVKDGHNYVDTSKFVTLMETLFPKFKQDKLTREAEFFLSCLEHSLLEFNPKGFDAPGWMYFCRDNNTVRSKATTKEVYNYFKKLCELHCKTLISDDDVRKLCPYLNKYDKEGEH